MGVLESSCVLRCNRNAHNRYKNTNKCTQIHANAYKVYTQINTIIQTYTHKHTHTHTHTDTHKHTQTHTLGQVHIPQARTSPQLDECRSFCLLVTPLASSSSGGPGALLPGPQHVLTIRRPPQRLPSPPTSLLVLLFIPLDPHGSPLPSQYRTIPV